MAVDSSQGASDVPPIGKRIANAASYDDVLGGKFACGIAVRVVAVELSIIDITGGTCPCAFRKEASCIGSITKVDARHIIDI